MNARAAWDVVERFERAIAEYCDAPYAVAVDSCTNALYLCFRRFWETTPNVPRVILPAFTYVGVPQAAMNAGVRVELRELPWVGEYGIHPTNIVDAARWLRRGMYGSGTWTCLSFHFSKHLPIGRGGAILCDDDEDAEWFRRAAYDGRDRTRPIMEQTSFQWGIHCYMPPEAAARGLLLMTNLDDDNQPLPGEYPDLSKVTFG